MGLFYVKNPTNDVLHYRLLDMNQKVVFEGINSNSVIELNIENYQSGMYFIHLFKDEKEKVIKLIKN
jgi:hypothetical protein